MNKYESYNSYLFLILLIFNFTYFYFIYHFLYSNVIFFLFANATLLE